MEIYFNDYRHFTVESMRSLINGCSAVRKADNASAATAYAYRAKEMGLTEAYKFWSLVSSGAYEAVSKCDPREKDPVISVIE